ncbi:hypothetical protein JJB98_05965 [Bradyrhizobium diazoefficiens]|nr:hypothetical protein [Bradyrhizobium diazoefficiens]QQO19476.1 hypothetical protein JJB98_05965 [Bradyrhizobium diazoefficiens]
MGYGEKEFAASLPIAEALEKKPSFRRWLIEHTEFAESAAAARLLSEEMHALRSRGTPTWWRSHYTESCRCLGCRGQETDLLAIFEDAESMRFAVHIEVKHAGDSFRDDRTQAAAYPIRALCWANRPPHKVLPHSKATTMLLCSAIRLRDYSKHSHHFKTVVTFEDIESAFPGLTGLF